MPVDKELANAYSKLARCDVIQMDGFRYTTHGEESQIWKALYESPITIPDTNEDPLAWIRLFLENGYKLNLSMSMQCAPIVLHRGQCKVLHEDCILDGEIGSSLEVGLEYLIRTWVRRILGKKSNVN